MTVRPLALYLGTLLWPAAGDNARESAPAGRPAARTARIARAFAHASRLGGPRLGDFDSVENDYYRFVNRPRD